MFSARADLTLEGAAELTIPFNYAPDTSRSIIEEDWAVRFPLASTMTGYVNQLVGASAWSGLERLPQLTVPTLVVHGELDRLVLPANGRMVAAAIPGAELAIVPGANHLLMSDRPAEVVDLLLAWIGRNAGDGAG